MTLRTAALYGRDPRDLRTTAEMLALRGVHPTPERPRRRLEAVRDAALPDQADDAPAIVAHLGPQRATRC